VCLFTGLFAGLQVYLAQRVWPDYHTLANPETAFMDVAQVVGGYHLFAGFGAILFISSLACGLAGHLGAVRLLYGMGRDNILPRSLFGYVNPRTGNPTYNVLIVGILAYVGTVTLQWERAVEILNFGALLAFMAVNAAALKHFAFGDDPARKVNVLLDVISPALGFLFCLAIFMGLQSSTLVAGAIWLAVGGAYLLLKTRSMNNAAIEIDFNES